MNDFTDLELQTAEMALSSVSLKLKARLDSLKRQDILELDEQQSKFLDFEINRASSKLDLVSGNLDWISNEIELHRSEYFAEFYEMLERLGELCGEYDNGENDEDFENDAENN